MRGKNVWVVCGTKRFGEVTSITTEGRRATVKFTREFTLNDTKAKLTECVLDPLQAGTSEASAVLIQDDSGNWTEK